MCVSTALSATQQIQRGPEAPPTSQSSHVRNHKAFFPFSPSETSSDLNHAHLNRNWLKYTLYFKTISSKIFFPIIITVQVTPKMAQNIFSMTTNDFPTNKQTNKQSLNSEPNNQNSSKRGDLFFINYANAYIFNQMMPRFNVTRINSCKNANILYVVKFDCCFVEIRFDTRSDLINTAGCLLITARDDLHLFRRSVQMKER